MTRPPTAAQRRVIDAAEPETGRITGTAAQLARLVALRLAFRHPRPPHDHFLTPAGHRFREAADAPASPEPVAAPAPGGVFTARLGGEPDAVATPARAREVRTAWQGLLEIRRMTHPDGATDRPCAWERGRLTHSAALALEAAGCVPATGTVPGYRVTDTPQPEAVAVRHPDPAALTACAEALRQAGWQVSEHTEARGGRVLLASPRRV
ncbi:MULTISPECIES: hypothetical protein [unclassified Streptomyces]|uniref:hypothetical protein n=1 Tax=unclassified Streptomyces TaxID=2593676 RepID=UPI000DBA70F6|nr:hypothetical protein [Streptomyces sp. PsTaAH-137]MYT71782.1 hypothetical protein [Streptomyces sp. SID8367]RAJ72616.1 hypothetical protein K377_07398 [Streptomyces sp. PsTaAH-137]